MKRKPTIKQLKNRSAVWFDGNNLRLTLCKEDLRKQHYCKCSFCLSKNSWWYDSLRERWWTSFFGLDDVRKNYEFVSFI